MKERSQIVVVSELDKKKLVQNQQLNLINNDEILDHHFDLHMFPHTLFVRNDEFVDNLADLTIVFKDWLLDNFSMKFPKLIILRKMLLKLCL